MKKYYHDNNSYYTFPNRVSYSSSKEFKLQKLNYFNYVKEYLKADSVIELNYFKDSRFQGFCQITKDGKVIKAPLIIYNYFLKEEMLVKWLYKCDIQIYNSNENIAFSGKWDFEKNEVIFTKSYNYPSYVKSSKSELSWI